MSEPTQPWLPWPNQTPVVEGITDDVNQDADWINPDEVIEEVSE